MQLMAYGAENMYLNGDPTVTHFKVLYRRHTNFSREIMPYEFKTKTNFGKKISTILPDTGDLISDIIVVADLPEIGSANRIAIRWTDNVGHYIIKTAEIEIGGQIIDKQSGEWLEIWSQLSISAGKREGYYKMIGQSPPDVFGRPTGLQKDLKGSNISGKKIYIPLNFWFCKDLHNALPIISLKHHDVKLNIEIDYIYELMRSPNERVDVLDIDVSLLIEFIYLDEEERKFFHNNKLTYLIDQVQVNEFEVDASAERESPNEVSVNLNFNNCVKELYWVVQADDFVNTNDKQRANYTAVKAPPPTDNTEETYIDNLGEDGISLIKTEDHLSNFINQSCISPNGALNPVIEAKLLLNDIERTIYLPGNYFNRIQPYESHTAIPFSPGINVLPFSLFPENNSPSGTCNFSKLNDVSLVLKLATYQALTKFPQTQYPGLSYQSPVSKKCKLRVYALSANILVIEEGIGGVIYDS